jgi:hypothetical protein
MVEVSSVLQGSLRAVREATEKCSSARGDDLIAARQELRTLLYEWVARLEALAREAPPKSRLPRMMRLTSDELWEMAEPWLSYEFVVAHRVQLTASEMSELQRDTWSRVEAAIAAYGETRGDDEVAARERLTRLADQIRTSSETAMSGDAMSERQLLMWRLAADEITGFVADAVARHPERR